jgi:hypothetical protein
MIPTVKDWQIEHALQVLRDNGYVVIPRERHVVLTVRRSISWWELERMQGSEELKRFNEYIDGRVARDIGYEMLRKGAITKTDLGFDNLRTRHETEWQAGIILPKE